MPAPTATAVSAPRASGGRSPGTSGLAEETGCAYHVCHVSTKESVALIRAAKRRGVDVTCETAPHYLTFTDEDLQEDGRFKMNPPLRGCGKTADCC